jgi:DNA-binding NarL/FixJ family response regulator
MNILIAEERKNLLSALKLLLETEIEKISYIGEVYNSMDLDKAVKEEKPDILIVDGDLINSNNEVEVRYFKEFYPDMSLVVIDFNHGKRMKYKKLDVDLFIDKGGSSARALNSLVKLVKNKVSRQ